MRSYLIGTVSKTDDTDQRTHLILAENMKEAIKTVVDKGRVVISISTLENDIEIEGLGWEKN